jgi:hypothetical protein
VSPKFAHPDPADLPAMVAEAAEMLEGANAERDVGRLKAAASLAINAAVRASDAICTSALGYHSCAPSHAAALDVLQTVPDSGPLLEALSSALSLKSLYNYHRGPVDREDVDAVIDDATSLVSEAMRRVAAGHAPP